MTEHATWNLLRARMPVGGHYSRIESHDTAPGFPDVHWTLEGKTGGFELKYARMPTAAYPFRGEKLGLRKTQHIWIRDELEAGGRVLLALQVFANIYFLEGRLHKAVDDMTLEKLRENSSLVWTPDRAHPEDLRQLMLSPGPV